MRTDDVAGNAANAKTDAMIDVQTDGMGSEVAISPPKQRVRCLDTHALTQVAGCSCSVAGLEWALLELHCGAVVGTFAHGPALVSRQLVAVYA